jgi:hypothetical protein
MSATDNGQVILVEQCKGGCGLVGPPRPPWFVYVADVDGYLCHICDALRSGFPLENGNDVAELDERVARNSSKDARFTERRIDLVAALAEPEKPTPWRVENLVADGTLTVIPGQADVGKSWLALAMAMGVYDSRAVAGMPCVRGRALYVDAEMGPAMFVSRLRAVQATGRELDYFDAGGLDLSRKSDLAVVANEINGYQLVVLDSLRALVPSKKENDSDDMAPVVTAIRMIARDTGAAVVLLHHRGDSDKFFRGTTSIRDQCDAMLALWEDEQGLRLRCQGGGKMRYAPKPEDLWLAVDPLSGGVTATEPGTPPPRAPRRSEMKDEIVAALPAPSKREVERRLGLAHSDTTFLAAWTELTDGGQIAFKDGSWVVVVLSTTPRDHHNTTTPLTVVEVTLECLPRTRFSTTRSSDDHRQRADDRDRRGADRRGS